MGVVLVQVDATAVQALERIATAQVIMAVAMGIIGLLAAGGGVFLLLETRRLRRLLRGLGATAEELRPRLIPLVDRVRDIADDVSGASDDVRRRLDALLHTVEDVNRSLRRGAAASEERVRRFGAVLDVVQTEAEELLLDAAATAHGVQETARRLREPPQRRHRGSGSRHFEDEEEGLE